VFCCSLLCYIYDGSSCAQYTSWLVGSPQWFRSGHGLLFTRPVWRCHGQLQLQPTEIKSKLVLTYICMCSSAVQRYCSLKLQPWLHENVDVPIKCRQDWIFSDFTWWCKTLPGPHSWPIYVCHWTRTLGVCDWLGTNWKLFQSSFKKKKESFSSHVITLLCLPRCLLVPCILLTCVQIVESKIIERGRSYLTYTEKELHDKGW
jgi:hypothetical protein